MLNAKWYQLKKIDKFNIIGLGNNADIKKISFFCENVQKSSKYAIDYHDKW